MFSVLVNVTVITALGGDTDVTFGADTLAAAGGVTLPAGASSISNAGGTNLIVSGGFVVPDTGGGVTAGTVVFDNAVEWVVAAPANTYSVRTEAEIGSAVSAGWSGKTILVRDGKYEWDYLWTRRKTFSPTAVLKAENWRQATFTADADAVPSATTMRSVSNFTLDGFVLEGAVTIIREAGRNTADITIQNNQIFNGNLIDPNGDYSVTEPSAPSGIITNSGPTTNLTIRNNHISNRKVGIVVQDDGNLTIEGNHIERSYEDSIKISSATTANIYIRDNFLEDVIANGATDVGNPHPDFIQFISVTVTGVVEIDRNVSLGSLPNAGAQGFYLDDRPVSSYHSATFRGNLLVNSESGSTTGIRVRQADTCIAYGNTVVGYDTSGGPGIVFGDDTTTGTHIAKNNAASSFSIAGSPTTANNVTLGVSGATVSYTSAFDGPDFGVTAWQALIDAWSMKTAGPLDLATNVGASGSGYVVWGSEPGATSTYVPGTFGFTP